MTRSSSTRDGASRPREPKFPRRRYYTRYRARRHAMLGGNQEGRTNHVTDQAHWEKMDILKPSEKGPGDSLRVSSVDCNKETNALEHHTDRYDLDDLVIRRGQSWALTLEFDRSIDKDLDVVTLQFAFGNKPKESNGTLLRIKLSLDGNETFSLTRKWAVKVEKVEGSKMCVKVLTPANAFVGRYGLFVETELKDKEDSRHRHEVEDQDFVLLFNAWNKDDLVYMANENERMEYVLNDCGRIWVGSAYSHHGRPWFFGQFENPVLEAALSLMDEAEIGDTARANPVTFVRALSALVNSMDDKGVLEGRWTEKYPKNCTLPWAWTGSVKIIKSFMEGNKSVKFGQCWVFSGVMTTLLRSLGVPTRSVTNFESAHDTDSSMTIDSHFDDDGEPAEWMNDSVWNFHVWNESFFKRLDLPEGYDGWQAHDGTPQELSEGVMRCGPAPLKAIKEGHVYMNYDVGFIFSEVNGDKVNWRVKKDGTMSVIGIDGKSVGKNISTKAVLSNERHDVTHNYKYPEGSEEERKVVEFVNRFSSRAEHDIYDSDIVKDVDFDLKFSESTMIGETLKTFVVLKSNSGQQRTIKGRLTVLGAFYTGVPGKRIKNARFDVQIPAGEGEELVLEIKADEYLPKLHPEASLQAYASFTVQETNQQFARTMPFALQKPSLVFKIADEIKAKAETTGLVEFTNTLPIALTNGVINLEGRYISSAEEFSVSHPIEPSQTISFQFELSPRRSGMLEIDATFTSDQLSGVDGSVELHVAHD